jgi:sensor histidine kinase YesM
MNLWISGLLNVFLVAIEFGIYLIFADVFFHPRFKKWKRFGVIVAFFVLNYVVLQLCPNVIMRQVFVFVIFFVLTKISYQATIVPSAFLSLAFLAIMNISDLVVIYGFTAMKGQGIAELAIQPYVYCILSYSAKFFELLLVIIVHAWGKARFQHKPSSALSYIRFGLFPLVTLFSAMLMYIAAAKAPQVAPELLFCVILLLLTDIGSILLLGMFERQQEKLTENNILHQQLDSAMDHITEATQTYENERKLTHDFQNQMIVIRGMVESGADTSEIIGYLDQVSNYTRSASLSISTHRTAVDVLLNQKYLAASKKGIDFQVRLDDLSLYPLPDNALVVLLSNLLDNAIEACEMVPDECQRKIIVKMSVGGNECLMSVENTVVGQVPIKDNFVVTTKADPQRHGYGMKNVAAIVAAYDGFYTLRCTDQVFQFAAVFPGMARERI